MFLAILGLNALLLTLTVLNAISMRRPSRPREISESVAVLLPARNEEENIERISNELIAQTHIENLRIIIVNDNSSDHTENIARTFQSERFTVINASEPQDGILGKVNALQQGFEFSQSDKPQYTIAIDADVSFSPDAISRAIATIKDLNLDFISAYPAQRALTMGERLVQPLLQWSWMSTLLLRGAEKFPMPSTVVANGQFFIVRTSALQSIGGFIPAAHHVLDDMQLARALVAGGYNGTVISGSQLAATRMYSSWSQIKDGYGKSLHRAFGGAIGSTVAALFMAASGVAPLIGALLGNQSALIALVMIIASRLIAASFSASRLSDAVLHSISSIAFLYLLYYSWTHRSIVQWKGRTL
jgi:cellulose synthase/poly-beta-1,6-N-acetylglucosamine synthase-like glycosyltransferase